MESLRQEIIEAQKSRSDLLKWKLVIVAAIAAIGLGLNENNEARPIVLIAIPLVSFYVDVLCRHLNLRILVIGAFVKTEQNEIAQYEAFVDAHRNVFGLEDFALQGSSYVLAASVALYGLGYLASLWVDNGPDGKGSVLLVSASLLVAGIGGFVLSRRVNQKYRCLKQAIQAPDPNAAGANGC